MDIWGRVDQVLMGGLSSDSMFVTWPALAAVGGGLGLLIQQINIDYRQPLRRIFEIGPGVIPSLAGGYVSAESCDLAAGNAGGGGCADRTQTTYYIIGRPEGQLQMGRFVGPNALTLCFYQTYGNPCKGNDMSISGQAGCNGGDYGVFMEWTMHGVVLNSERADITGQEMIIQEQLGAMFVGLDLAINGETTCTTSAAGGGTGEGTGGTGGFAGGNAGGGGTIA